MLEPPPHVEHLGVVDSTSLEARRRVRAGAEVDGLALVAEDQTAGHGRRGSVWAMLPGRCLAVTFVRPLPAGVRSASLMARLAVAACRGVEAAGSAPLAIKWPNDILRGDRKAGGLLVEVVADPAGRDWLLIGLGLNLRLGRARRPAGMPAHATDVGLEAGLDVADRVLAGVLLAFDTALAQLGTPADTERGAEYVRRAWIVGRRVTLEHRGQTLRTTIREVSPDGDLRTTENLLLQGEHVQLVEVEGLG